MQFEMEMYLWKIMVKSHCTTCQPRGTHHKIVPRLSPVAAGEHGALDVEEAGALGIPAKQSGLHSVVNHQSVTVAQVEISIDIVDATIAVAVPIMVNCHPMGTIHTISDDTLRRGGGGAIGGSAVKETISVLPE